MIKVTGRYRFKAGGVVIEGTNRVMLASMLQCTPLYFDNTKSNSDLDALVSSTSPVATFHFYTDLSVSASADLTPADLAAFTEAVSPVSNPYVNTNDDQGTSSLPLLSISYDTIDINNNSGADVTINGFVFLPSDIGSANIVIAAAELSSPLTIPANDLASFSYALDVG